VAQDIIKELSNGSLGFLGRDIIDALRTLINTACLCFYSSFLLLIFHRFVVHQNVMIFLKLSLRKPSRNTQTNTPSCSFSVMLLLDGHLHTL
jgi:hypothetical protein